MRLLSQNLLANNYNVTFVGSYKSGYWKNYIKNKLIDIFPEEFVQKRKRGFSFHIDDWFSNSNQGNYILNEFIVSRNSKLHSIFNSSELEKQVLKRSTHSKISRLLWNLLVLRIWMNK